MAKESIVNIDTVKRNITTSKVKEKTMEERIIEAAHRTWQAIAPDADEACGGTCTLANAMEFVMDADRMFTFGEDNEAYEFFRKMKYDDMKKVIRKALKGYF
jgi:hypothetical protein